VRPRLTALVAGALLVMLLAAGPGATIAAAAGCPRANASDIADEVMCLQCGVPLNLAENAPSARRERAFIQQLVDQCRTKAQIKTALVAQFGDNVLADPKGKTAWLVPAIAFAAAVVALAFGALRWRRGRDRDRLAPAAAAAAGADAPKPPSGDAARLQADLDRYDL
jgi:cytochrome c-type biogenesis protein CcmH/NrfF